MTTTPTSEGTKKCWSCGEIKPLSAFHKCSANKDGRQGRCSQCSYVIQLRHRGAAVPPGVVPVPPQGHVCPLCDATSPGGTGGWHLDHDHTTGRIRGWLCSTCNRMLGFYERVPDMRERIETYLQHSA